MAPIRYDRDTLISIGLQSTYEVTPDPSWPTEIQRDPRERQRKKKVRGKRAGVQNWLMTRPKGAVLPTILLSNIQSVENSLQDLQAREKFHKDIQRCNLLCFTQTKLNPTAPDPTVQPAERFSVHRLDASTEPLPGQVCGGGGLCLMVSRFWCLTENIHPLTRFCSHNLKLLSIRCRPLCLPQHFSSVIVSAVCVPPHADTDSALLELHRVLTQQQAQHPDAALIVAGDFSGAELRRVLPGFHQHVSGPGKKQRCYSPFRGAYTSQPYRPHGKSVHAATFLMPTYTQQQEAPVHSEVTAWIGQSVSVIHPADWEMFRSCAGFFFKESFELLRI